MGEHRTALSKAIISSIADLGTVLGYHVRREWDIPGTGPHPEQIDLAFFVDDRAATPAFAIEIDSADVPASMSNAVKIFGKTTQALVKPFFVFHIFVEVAQQGTRRWNAETAFITQNYRTYSFKDEKQTFLHDLLDRHRAIRADLDFCGLAQAIDGDLWDSIDRYAVLDYAAEQLDARRVRLAEVARVSLDTMNMRGALARLVSSSRAMSLPTGGLGFIGRMFRWPLLLGLRQHAVGRGGTEAFEELKRWQQGPELIFSPKTTFLGLSQEFDFAISELAPPVFCLVAVLFKRDAVAAHALCAQMFDRATDGTLGNQWERYGLIWCAIAGVKVGAFDIAERAIAKINELGGFPLAFVAGGLSTTLSEDGETDWAERLSASAAVPIAVSSLQETLATIGSSGQTLDRLVAELLVNDKIIADMNHRILSL